MSQNQTDADMIVREMQQVRSDLQDDVQHLVAQARTLTDWRHYVRTYPWACVGAAAAIGYLVIPARKKVLQLDASGVRALAGQQQLVVRVDGDNRRTSGLFAALAGMAVRSLMNGGLALVTQQLSQMRGTSTANVERDSP